MKAILLNDRVRVTGRVVCSGETGTVKNVVGEFVAVALDSGRSMAFQLSDLEPAAMTEEEEIEEAGRRG